jgi:hypothetical protein
MTQQEIEFRCDATGFRADTIRIRKFPGLMTSSGVAVTTFPVRGSARKVRNFPTFPGCNRFYGFTTKNSKR